MPKSYFKKFTIDETHSVYIVPEKIVAVEETTQGVEIHFEGGFWLITEPIDDVLQTLRRVLKDNISAPEPTVLTVRKNRLERNNG